MHRLFNQIDPFPIPIGRWILSLVTSMVLWTCFQTVGIHWTVIRSREIPPEADDAYGYILKAATLSHCPLQDCPALTSLREQTTADPEGSNNPNIRWMRERQYHRVLNQYHLTHSMALLLIHGFGVSWEDAYDLLQLTGSFFIGLSLWVWFSQTWSPVVAPVAMGFCALTIVPMGHGIHWVVPNTLCLASGLLTWAIAFLRQGWALWLLPPGILALCFLHPSGVLYAGGVLFILVCSRRLKERHARLVAAISTGVLIMHRILLLWVEQPALSFRSLGPPLAVDEWLDQVRANGEFASEMVTNWFGNLFLIGQTPPADLLLAGSVFAFGINICLAGRLERERLWVNGLLCIGMMVIGMLYVLPGYPLEGVTRLGMPLIVLLIGTFSATGCHVLDWLNVGLKRVRITKTINLLLVVAMVAGMILGWFFIKGRELFILPVAERIANRGNVLLYDSAQPRLLSKLGSGGVLYLAETPMYFYLIHGGFSNKAVYYPAVFGSPQEARWLESNPNLSYSVSPHPIAHFRLSRESSLTVISGGETETRRTLFMRFSVRGGPARIQIESRAIVLPVGLSTWIPIEMESMQNTARVHMEDASAHVSAWVAGIREDKEASLSWPWDSDIRVVWHSDGVKEWGEFKTKNLVPLPFQVTQILGDNGGTVLCEIKRSVDSATESIR